jgi:hypothetical protein
MGTGESGADAKFTHFTWALVKSVTSAQLPELHEAGAPLEP